MTHWWKVGELAKRAKVTVRTLHHYDAIGLLPPSSHSESGHRLYSEHDAEQLARIVLLKNLGLTLDEVRDCLRRPEYALAPTLRLHIQRLEQELDAKANMLERLRILESGLGANPHISDLLNAGMEAATMIEKYYTQEQLDSLQERYTALGEERIQEVQHAWQELFDAFNQAMDAGLPPSHPDVQALTARSAALISEFTGGDPGVLQSLNTMYKNEGGPNVLNQHNTNMKPELWEYMAQARAAASKT